MNDLVLILRYRKAVTYGFHALLGALETHETATSYAVVFAETVQATIEAIRAASAKTLVLWSFYSPDFAFRAFSLRWNKFSALEITRGCAYACQYKRGLLSQGPAPLRAYYIA